MRKILVTGARGQVGWELLRTLAPLGEVVGVDMADLDLCDAEAVRAYVRALQPAIIVNPAAYTAVDKAEAEPDLALQVNAIAPGILAAEAKRLGAWLVHYSTDYVFDGTKPGPYDEDDLPNPQSVYGKTKLAGEIAVRESGCKHLILRTSWVYGARGHNFMLTMLRLGQEREELRVVADQIGAPTWCRNLAEATAQLLTQLHSPLLDPAHAASLSGLYHLTDGGETSWFGFAAEIIRQGLPERAVKMIPIDTGQYPLAAPRPANSRLSNQKLQQHFGLSSPAWQTALACCLADRAR
ncbi:dTDP-4-dehydrorhamnose reductase [Ferriphaselus sp. R-1]|uniref:dTDP-4-dehydrorhamnose reductase n=1 Tax=Ferriphaselus sp. R-1 TaxID=1485544 RepID=UPI000558C4B9|nr:dTDP-4-dehydrorhamnose reductase [Ferriphaselus sp. R-1]